VVFLNPITLQHGLATLTTACLSFLFAVNLPDSKID